MADLRLLAPPSLTPLSGLRLGSEQKGAHGALVPSGVRVMGRIDSFGTSGVDGGVPLRRSMRGVGEFASAVPHPLGVGLTKPSVEIGSRFR